MKQEYLLLFGEKLDEKLTYSFEAEEGTTVHETCANICSVLEENKQDIFETFWEEVNSDKIRELAEKMACKDLDCEGEIKIAGCSFFPSEIIQELRPMYYEEIVEEEISYMREEVMSDDMDRFDFDICDANLLNLLPAGDSLQSGCMFEFRIMSVDTFHRLKDRDISTITAALDFLDTVEDVEDMEQILSIVEGTLPACFDEIKAEVRRDNYLPATFLYEPLSLLQLNIMTIRELQNEAAEQACYTAWSDGYDTPAALHQSAIA